jgi:hypothetical protein
MTENRTKIFKFFPALIFRGRKFEFFEYLSKLSFYYLLKILKKRGVSLPLVALCLLVSRL